jgi:hypothetical protein
MDLDLAKGLYISFIALVVVGICAGIGLGVGAVFYFVFGISVLWFVVGGVLVGLFFVLLILWMFKSDGKL